MLAINTSDLVCHGNVLRFTDLRDTDCRADERVGAFVSGILTVFF